MYLLLFLTMYFMARSHKETSTGQIFNVTGFTVRVRERERERKQSDGSDCPRNIVHKILQHNL